MHTDKSQRPLSKPHISKAKLVLQEANDFLQGPAVIQNQDSLGNSLVELVNMLKSAKNGNQKELEANSHSISDSNGGRIELNRKLKNKNVIKK